MSRRISQIEFAIGATLFVIIVVLVFVASVMRFFKYPLIWSVDMAQLLFIWLCFLGATKAMRERAHLGVDLIVRQFGHRYRLIIETVLAAVFITFMMVLAFEGYELTLLNRERLYGDSGISYAYVTIAVPIGCLALTAAILANVVESWRKRAGGKTLVFSRENTPDAVPEEVGDGMAEKLDDAMPEELGEAQQES